MTRVLLVIDLQVDFIDGVFGTKQAKTIIPKVVDKIKQNWNNIYYTQDTHTSRYQNTLEGQNLPSHCIEGTTGIEINKEILEALSNKILEDKKVHVQMITKFSFGSTGLACELFCNKEFIDEIHLVGLCTDICVISNALLLRAHFPDKRIIVDASCCAGTTPENHQKALDIMKLNLVEVINE